MRCLQDMAGDERHSKLENCIQNLFRKHKLQLHSDAPVADLIRLFNIIEILELCIHRLLTDTENFTDASTHRDCPFIATIGFPYITD